MKITVISQKDIGLQVLKDHLTEAERKVIKHMIDNDVIRTAVSSKSYKKKTFFIDKTAINEAEVTIWEHNKSEILGKLEHTKRKVKIKWQ